MFRPLCGEKHFTTALQEPTCGPCVRKYGETRREDEMIALLGTAALAVGISAAYVMVMTKYNDNGE